MTREPSAVSVLLVDDKPENLLALEAVLGDLDLNLVQAQSGEAALGCLLRDDFAVILLDVFMPGMDGMETAALIRRRERSHDTPIIFVTAAGRNDDLMRSGYVLGAVDYIVKPIQPNVLRSKVVVFAELARQRAQVTQQAAELGALNAELEARVKARTAELERAVADLEQQIAERTRVEAERAALLVREQTARRAAESAEQRAAFLAETSAVLDASLDYTVTLTNLARLAVPRLGDVCWIDVAEGERGIKPIAAVAADPSRHEAATALQRHYAPTPSASALGHPITTVLQTHVSLLIPDVSDRSAQTATVALDAEYLRLMRELGAVSYMVVPLHTHGRTLGALTCATVESGRIYDSADVALAEEVGRRAAQAVDNARLYEQAREAVQLRDDFLSVASHELKTPITSLTAALQILQRASERGSLGDVAPERVRRMLDVVESQAKRLVKLVNELLDVSRLSEGRLQLDLEEVDLAAIVGEVVERFREEIVLARCAVEVQAPEHAAGWWDRSRLEQVVTNLLSNALKYGAGTEVRISVDTDTRQARLVVADQGIGIAPEYLPHIFGRFERAVSAKEYSGVGLGLYIVREIVTALGGTVAVTSERGQGTAFTVELPLRAAELDPAANGAESAAPAR